jgi:outer membrane biosynthesis protein TonB
MWGKFFAAALKDSKHPSFKDFPWSFSKWDSQYSTSPSASPSPSESGSEKPDPDPTKTITPKPDPTKTTAPPTPQPTPTKTKPPKPTPTPTGTPSAAPKQVVMAAWTPEGARGEAVASATTTGAGDTGAAGALVRWVAGLLGL